MLSPAGKEWAKQSCDDNSGKHRTRWTPSARTSTREGMLKTELKLRQRTRAAEKTARRWSTVCSSGCTCRLAGGRRTTRFAQLIGAGQWKPLDQRRAAYRVKNRLLMAARRSVIHRHKGIETMNNSEFSVVFAARTPVEADVVIAVLRAAGLHPRGNCSGAFRWLRHEGATLEGTAEVFEDRQAVFTVPESAPRRQIATHQRQFGWVRASGHGCARLRRSLVWV
jgi:hypothetical protein